MAGEPNIEIETEDQPVVVEIEADEDEALHLAQEQEPVAEPEKETKGGPELVAEQLAAAQNAWAQREAQLIQERDEALRYAQEREQGEWQAGRQAIQSHSDLVQTALQNAQTEQRAAQQAFAAADEVGDSAAKAEAMARISRAATDIRQYEFAAADADRQAEYAKRQPPPQQRQPQPAPRLLTAQEILASNEINPKLYDTEKAWLRMHTDASLNPVQQKKLKEAFDYAQHHGIVRGSEQYFQFLNERLGYEKPMAQERSNGSRVSAPVSRGSGGSPSKPQKVTLTADDRQIMQSMGLTSEADQREYARNKLNVANRQKEINQQN